MTPIFIRVVCTLMTLCVFQSANGQLSSTHYLPPVFSSEENAQDGLRRQSIYLSTPSATPIDVNIQSADGVTFDTTLTISNTSEGILDFNDYYGDNDLSNNNTFIGIREGKLNTPLTDEGLFFSSTAPFLVSYRVVSNAQGDILSTKGEFAIGTEFKLGALPLSVFDLSSDVNRNIFASFLALEDDTDITIDGYDPNILFRMSDGTYQTIPPPMIISLDANQSYVIAADRNGNNITGINAGIISSLIGSNITSTNPIVINSGNLTLSGSAANSSGSRDFGLDQSVPIQYLGNTYAFIKGNSTGANINTFERPLIIATSDNTDIYINGVLDTTLQEGQYLDVPGSNFSTDGTMLIETTNRVYAYQALSGNNSATGIGMNFIPPLNCYLQREVDFIPSVENLHPDITMTPFINVITYTGSTITITENGGTPDIIPTSSALPIPGTSDWVAYSVSGYTGNIKVESTGPSMISLFGQNGVIGAAGYFSGFGGNPQIEIIATTGGIDDCYDHLSMAEIPENTTDFYWVRSSDNEIVSKDTVYIPTECGNYELHVFNGTCNDVVTISVDCDPNECFIDDDNDDDGIWVVLDQDDDNDGILDNVECPDIDAVTNGNFDSNSTWSTTGNWNITGGEIVNNGTSENNTTLEQSVSNLDNACFNQLLMSFDIRVNSAPITSTDTAQMIIELAGIPLIEINSPNGDSVVTLKRLQTYIVLNRAAFVINPTSDLSYTNIQVQMDWSGQPSSGNLTFDFSNDGDPITMDNISLTFLDCTQDFDGDGIPNCQDPDSDNDGCLDALEGDANLTFNNIQGDTLTGGVDSVGIPLIASGGQGPGSSLIFSVQDLACSECHIDHPSYADFDGDGIANACDFDNDNDGIRDDTECPLGTGLVSSPFTSLAAAFSAPSTGRYYFDLGSGIFQANVDISAGGGWVQVLQYHHQGGTNPDLSIINTGSNLPVSNNSSLGTDLSEDSDAWGHLGNAGMADLSDMDEIRWYAETSNHSRIIHFKSSVGVNYSQTGAGSFNGIESGFTLLSGHSANLPTAVANEYTNQGDLALTNFPFWLSGTYHWGIKGLGNRWEVDDYDAAGFSHSTIHKVWVRNSIGSTATCDSDNDGVEDYLDLDSDNDGILDEYESEPCPIGTSASNPFTSIAEAIYVTTAGIYYFDIAGTTFSTYIDANGYVKIALDFGNGSGNLPQLTSLDNNSTRGILTPAALATLTDITEVKITHSSGNLDIVSTNSTLLSRITSNTTLHNGSIDNTFNNSWVGINANYVTGIASCNTSSGGSLHQNIIHLCGNSSGFHWIPSGSYQRLIWSQGDISSTESFSLWVKGGGEICRSDVDTDNDNIPDRIDSDSDNDGCNDTREEDIYDPDNDGVAGIGTAVVDINGLVTTIIYTLPTNNFWQNINLLGSVCQECRTVKTNRHISTKIKY
ncbi:MAG: IgGFc-binding protein [Saprospiraceae bacterium]